MVNVFDYLKPYFEIDSFALGLVFFFAAAFFCRSLRFSCSAVGFIIAFGLLLRMVWICFSSHEPQFSWGASSLIENDWINMNAVDLTQGKWFLDANGIPTGRRPIGYPMVLGLLYKIFGTHANVAWGFHLVLFGFTGYFIYAIAKRVFNEQVGVLSALFFAIYPVSVFSVKLITDEHLFLFLWFGGILFLIRDLDLNKSKWSWLILGLIFGFAAMTRTYAIYMPVVAGLGYFLKKRPWKQTVAVVLLMFAVMQLVNLPWVIRNYKVWGVPIVYAVAGHSVYNFTNPMATPEKGHFPVPGEEGYSDSFARAYVSGNEGQFQREANREVRKWFFRDPIAFSSLAVSKLLYFMHWGKQKGVWPIWYQYTEGHYAPDRPLSPGLRTALENIAYVSYYILFHAFLMALIVLWRKRATDLASMAGLGVLLGSLVFWFGLHLIIMPDPKYRFPVEPLMMPFAAYLFCKLSEFKYYLIQKQKRI